MTQQADVVKNQWELLRRFPVLPGLALSAAIALACMGFRSLTGLATLNPIVLAILVGVLIQNSVGLGQNMRPGLTFSAKRVLRLGIVILGLQLTLEQVFDLGLSAMFVLATTLIATFFVIRFLGRLLGVDRALTDLIATGTAVCGASAIIAANTVSKGSEEDVAYAIACISILGTVSMLMFPLLAGPLGLDDIGFGLWVGATVHEVAQVTAASFQHSDMAGQYGTVSKLARVVMLAPLVMGMAFFYRGNTDSETRTGPLIPWFVVGFVAMIIFNSLVTLPDIVSDNVGLITTFMLATALAAVGLQIDARKLYSKGASPLILGILGWLFISIFGYALLKLFNY